MNNNWDKPFWRSTLCESDGTGSNTRLCIVLVVFVSLLILFYLAVKRPDTFVAALPLVTAFDVAVCGALYGINRASGVADKYLDTKTAQPAQPATPQP